MIPISRSKRILAKEFIDTEFLGKKPSRRKVWELSKVRRNLRVLYDDGSWDVKLDLTAEDSRALAWIGDEASLLYLSSYSDDPQTLAIAARTAEGLEPPSSIMARLTIASRKETTTQTLNFLSTIVGFGISEELIKNPNTPAEALERLLTQPHATVLVDRIINRENISAVLAVKVAVRAAELGMDASPELKVVLCRELGEPLGLLVWVEASRQIAGRGFPNIDKLTAWAKIRTANWDSRTVAALGALRDTAAGLDGETLCLAVEELAASRQSTERKGDPVEKSAQTGPAQSI